MALPRFHHAVIAAILIHGLHAAAMPTMVLAADQEMPRRHSLIHHSAIETAVPSATTHETTLPSSNDKPTHITRPIGPPIAAIVPPAIALPDRDQASSHCFNHRPCALALHTPCSLAIRHCSRTGHAHDSNAHHNTDSGTSCWNDFTELCCGRPDHSLSVGRNSRCSLDGLSKRRKRFL